MSLGTQHGASLYAVGATPMLATASAGASASSVPLSGNANRPYVVAADGCIRLRVRLTGA